MDPNPLSKRDPVDCFLETSFPPELAASLRPSLQLRTLRVLRHRRRWRQLCLVAALAGCYLAGLATAHFATARRVDSVATTNQHTAAGIDEKAEAVSVAAPGPLPVDQDPDVSARVLERLASASQEQRGVLYRAAGDRYLTVDGDLTSALRCYRLSLGELPEQALAISADDSWLLLALKKARLEERKDAKHTG
jgi:hypothetical protein